MNYDGKEGLEDEYMVHFNLQRDTKRLQKMMVCDWGSEPTPRLRWFCLNRITM